MLTAKENMKEVMKGGNPDRFVNQYEALRLLFHPNAVRPGSLLEKGEENVINPWGVYNSYFEGTPGQFPVHTEDKILVKDIEHWRDYVKAPSLDFPDEMWAVFKQQYDEVDASQSYRALFIAPGLFEQTHNFCEITNALMYYITNPDEMHDMIKYLMEWELQLAELICKHIQPEAIFHHDDWGTEQSTFLRPEMFAEFFVEPYKEIYDYYHNHGVELIVHHNDSYSATLVPYMIEMGIDVWQGCMHSNNVPELIEKYGGQITFMGGLDNKFVDFDGWTQEDARKAVRKVCDECGTKYFIPCITQGGPGSLYPGTYKAMMEEIDAYSEVVFGTPAHEITRLEPQILF